MAEPCHEPCRDRRPRRNGIAAVHNLPKTARRATHKTLTSSARLC